MKEKIESEVRRFKHFQRGVLGIKDKIEIGDVDIRNYAKYILREGKDSEKRDLMQSFKSKLILLNKRIVLE